MPALKRSIEVDTDSVAGGSRILVGQRENKGGVITQADPPLADAQAALWLAEEHHIRREREVVVILQGVTSEKLWSLGHTVTTWLPEEQMDKHARKCFVSLRFYNCYNINLQKLKEIRKF